MQAAIQKADEGDEDLAKDTLKRITNLQKEGGDGDVEAQFLRRIFRRVSKSVRRFLRRPMRIYRRIRKRYSRIRRMFGRMVHGYRKIRSCVRSFGENQKTLLNSDQLRNNDS